MFDGEAGRKVVKAVPVAKVWKNEGLEKSGCSSMVEQKPSKLMTRVRFPSPAPVSIGHARQALRVQLKLVGSTESPAVVPAVGAFGS